MRERECWEESKEQERIEEERRLKDGEMRKRFRSRVYLIPDSLFIFCTSWQFIHSLLKLWKWCHSIHQLFWQERRGNSRAAYKPVYGNTLDTTATTTTTTVVPRKTAMTSFETQWKTKYFALAAWVQLLCPLPSRGSQKQREVHGRIPVEVDGKSSSLFGLLFSFVKNRSENQRWLIVSNFHCR